MLMQSKLLEKGSDARSGGDTAQQRVRRALSHQPGTLAATAARYQLQDVYRVQVQSHILGRLKQSDVLAFQTVLTT